MISQTRKEAALKIAIMLICALSLVIIISGIMLLRQNTPDDMTGARYVAKISPEAHIHE